MEAASTQATANSFRVASWATEGPASMVPAGSSDFAGSATEPTVRKQAGRVAVAPSGLARTRLQIPGAAAVVENWAVTDVEETRTTEVPTMSVDPVRRSLTVGVASKNPPVTVPWTVPPFTFDPGEKPVTRGGVLRISKASSIRAGAASGLVTTTSQKPTVRSTRSNCAWICVAPPVREVPGIVSAPRSRATVPEVERRTPVIVAVTTWLS